MKNKGFKIPNAYGTCHTFFVSFKKSTELQRPLLVSRSSKGKMFSESRGSLRFKIQHLKHLENLKLTILEALDLPAMDFTGKSDPYVEVILNPKGTKCTTKSKREALNPKFDEIFNIRVSEKDLKLPEAELVFKGMKCFSTLINFLQIFENLNYFMSLFF